MKAKTSLILVSFVCLLISLLAQINAKRQAEVLSSIYKFAKLHNKIDRSSFNASNDLHEAAQLYSQEGLKEKDRIERLPGQPPVRFNQYGGYVTVNRTAGRAFYYYLAEAQTSKDSSPFLLWLNGGPGCSSFGYGAMEELGPFRVHSDDKTLYQNKFSWNHAANVLFLESPVGVGFSYLNTSADYESNGDRRTAIDNYRFLVNWLERFPEYKNRDFYIAGESYVGHYIPQLAQTILHHNKMAEANNRIIHLKGVIIGNGFMNWHETSYWKGVYEYCWGHGLVSDEIMDRIMRYCFSSPRQKHECSNASIEALDLAFHVNEYNIYAPLCANYTLITQYPNKASVLHMDPCSDTYVAAYMNRPHVQKALHANLTNIPYPWRLCGDDSPPNVTDGGGLMANGLRLWLYSGDLDANVPFTSTKNYIKELKLSIKTSWRPWYHGHEVGGYTQVYEGDLTFATVRGAGHEVPSYHLPTCSISYPYQIFSCWDGTSPLFSEKLVPKIIHLRLTINDVFTC